MRNWSRTIRVASILTIILATCAVANAYTLVMRSGRRIEIPSQFVVTALTLTYEVSPGMQVTHHLRAIDIDATERANNEAPGSLMKRAHTIQLMTPNVSTGAAVRTITNQDLQESAQRRQQSEVAYSKRIEQLGLPTVAESRARAEAESDAIRAELKENAAAEGDRESYWRGRASDLRTETAALDAEIAYVRARLEEMPNNTWNNGNNSFTTVLPLGSWGEFGRDGYGGYGRHNTYGRGNRANVYSAPGTIGSQGSRSRGYRRSPRYIDRRYPYGNVGPFGLPGGILGIPPYGVFPSGGYPNAFPDYDSYERNELITRFNDLSAKRAGFGARWRELENEARRAGIPPGWLRE